MTKILCDRQIWDEDGLRRLPFSCFLVRAAFRACRKQGELH